MLKPIPHQRAQPGSGEAFTEPGSELTVFTYLIEIGSFWLKFFTCWTVRTPGPTQAAALPDGRTVPQSTVPPLTKQLKSQVTSSVWLPPPTFGATKSPLCMDRVDRIRSKKHWSGLVSRAQAAI